jgi:hypothetical protein
MRPITASELLDLWELVVNDAGSRSPLDQSAIFLLLAFPELNRETLDELTIGQRESHLLQLRRRLFGPALDGLANCPDCGQVIEFSIEIPLDEAVLSLSPGESKAGFLEVFSGSYEITIRSLTVADVREAADGNSPLWRKALVEAKTNGESIAIGDVPESVQEVIASALQKADPLADILLDMSCPACEHQWRELLDPTSYFIAELGQWAAEILYTVGQLARTYNWREADILEMSAWRRAYYLELAGQ